ncbi:MAG: epoxyqueuosine reductase [Lentisphaerae bacterium]|jgi:epoxyqueuosine reductase|nr:epoxyqueuosine reductase [Lentisphaerota bacterium]
MLTSAQVKTHALNSGANIVGIASPDRFAELPARFNPMSAFPEAKSVVVLGFRLLRGLYRGMRAGTMYASFSMMGYAGTKWVFQPVALWKFCNIFEDAGYEASPITDNFPWSNLDGINPDEMGQEFIDVNPNFFGKDSSQYSKPVDPKRPAPDIYIQMRLAAYCAGLGEIGDSGVFLTPEYGPRQMFAIVLTDAELEPDPIFPGGLCDHCGKCIQECPARAISPTEKQTVKIAGRTISWNKLDFAKCSVGYHGGGENSCNPFITSEADEVGFNQQPYTKARTYKLGPIYWSGRALGGLKGCHQACMAHLEERGVLKNKFHVKFGDSQC